MNIVRTLIVFLFFGVILAPGAEAQTLSRGPLISNEDALTSRMTIQWWTDVTGNSTVDYGTTTSLGQSVTIGQAGSCEVGAAGTCHKVKLTGLQPGTRYYYRLSTNGLPVSGMPAVANTYFDTFKDPTDTSEIFFDVLGDWGFSSSTSGGQWNVATQINTANPPLLMTVGDNVYTTGTQSEWDTKAFIAPIKSLLQRSVFMPTEGNHDYGNSSSGESAWATQPAIQMFALPRNAPAGQEERYYSFDHGDVHFVVLDANPPALSATQDAWLDNDLATSSRKWKLVFFHQMPYTCASGVAAFGNDTTVRGHFSPILEKYGVDIAFTGHNHVYERTVLIDAYLANGSAGQDGLGTRYVVNGAGGASLDGQGSADGGGPYCNPGFLAPKTYCTLNGSSGGTPYLATGCVGGASGFCSVATYSYVEVKIQNNTTLTMRALDQNNAVIDTLTITKNTGGSCGNGVVEGAEQCDQGAANGTSTSCCTAACGYVTAGISCRPSAGTCDVAETCSGSSATCPADGFVASGTVCRAATGVCDVAETCSGASAACPGDGVVGAGTGCRASAGICDVAESCDGSNTSCPADGFVAGGTICRAAVGTCDLAESCTGASAACPSDAVVTAGTECRPATGSCDLAETCDGASGACPGDAFVTAGTTCRAANGVCDVAETCSGSSAACPSDGFATNGTTCRASAGVCDVAETCTGGGPACPADGFASTATVCRPASTVCDAAETCTGTSASCPADGFAAPSTVCRPAVSICDVAENCSGSSAACPGDVVAASAVVCRPSAGACDVPEQCDGVTTACPANNLAPTTTTCRPSAGVCDVAENCSGTSAACPINAFAASTVTCRAAAGVCDTAETCSGSAAACPPDAFLGPAVECRPSAGTCDVPEECSGVDASCPPDTGQPDDDGDGTCDLEDDCPFAADPIQADADGDGLGDACDPCTDPGTVRAVKAKLTLQNLALPLGDDRFKFSGTMTVPSAAINPATAGFRVILTDASGQTIADATVPSGLYNPATAAGWKVNGPQTTFVYKNKGGTIPSLQGISKVLVKRISKVPGQFKFSMSAVGGSYPLPASLPVKGTIILDPPYAATNQCGDAVFPGPTSPACAYVAPPGTIKCK